MVCSMNILRLITDFIKMFKIWFLSMEFYGVWQEVAHYSKLVTVQQPNSPAPARVCRLRSEYQIYAVLLCLPYLYGKHKKLPHAIELHSLVPRPLPDFISQPWRKIGRRPGTITTSRAGNGGLDSYVMWTRFHNDGNVPTQCAASTASDRTVEFV